MSSSRARDEAPILSCKGGWRKGVPDESRRSLLSFFVRFLQGVVICAAEMDGGEKSEAVEDGEARILLD